MNSADPTVIEPAAPTPESNPVPGALNPGPGGSWNAEIKSWIKRLPFFPALDFYRRKALDSPLFDFRTRTLARTLEDWPRALLIDITNRCNAKCVWCPNPDLTHLGAMDMDLYRKLIDDYGPRGGVVTFGTFGEPLMDKHMRERVEYLVRYPRIQKIEILTNAFFLNSKIVPVLLGHSVGVDISLDELDPKTFEDVKQMSFEVVRGNILAFLAANDRHPRPVPVNIRIKTLKPVEETLQNPFFQSITGHACNIVLNSIDDNIISNWAGVFDKSRFLDQYKVRRSTAGRYTHKRFNQENPAPCTQLWKWMVVYWDGSVVLCCADMFSQHVVGNVKENSIGEIWNGPEFRSLRQSMEQRKRFETPLCQNCDIHLSWHNLHDYYDGDGRFRSDRPFIMG